MEEGDTHTFTVAMTEGSTLTNVGTQPNVIATVDGVAVTTGTATTVGNYTVTTADGALTVNPKEITLTVDHKTKTYGEADEALTITLKNKAAEETEEPAEAEEGEEPTEQTAEEAPAETDEAAVLVGEDTLNYTLARAAGENAGEYAIKVTLGENPNYIVEVIEDVYEIIPKAASITANNTGKTYGGEESDLTATVSGVIEGEELSYTLAREPGEDAGTYAIIITLSENPNYDVTVQDGTYTIAPKPVTVKANDKTKDYGAEDPALDATAEGLVGSDAVEYTLSREPGEEPGEYEISVTGEEEQGNYIVSYESGKLTIGEKPEEEPEEEPTEEPEEEPTEEPTEEPEPTPGIEEEPIEEPEILRYSLVIHYWTEDGETAEPDFRATYDDGAHYNVTSPAKAGYTVDLAAVTGTITGDTEINVFYTKRTYTLTVKFQTTSGRELTDSLVMQMQSGDSYSFAVPEFEGYEALTARVEGVMNSQNKEVIVTYIEVAETNEEGQKVYTITGKPTVMINDYMTPLGIGQINRGGGESIE